jgi:hypothetical protein
VRRLAPVLALLAFLAVASAPAAVPKPVTVERYCSQTGDICFGIFRKQGAIFLDLTAAAKYFDRYTLCVRTPKRTTTCRKFPLRRVGRFFASHVRWHASFPPAGAGRYRVSWRLQRPLGPSLSFTLN